MIRDQMTYLVVCSHGQGFYVPERNSADLDRATTIRDIASGELSHVAQVLEINPVEGTCRDVTEDMAREVMTAWANDGEPLLDGQYEFIQLHVSIQAANSFRRADD